MAALWQTGSPIAEAAPYIFSVLSRLESPLAPRINVEVRVDGLFEADYYSFPSGVIDEEDIFRSKFELRT